MRYLHDLKFCTKFPWTCKAVENSFMAQSILLLGQIENVCNTFRIIWLPW